MAYQNRLIQPFSIGEETDLQPHLIPDSSFAYLRNVHLYRGRIRRKFGYSNLGRLTIHLMGQALGNHAVPSGAINVFTVLGLAGAIIPGTVTVTHAISGAYTDLVMDGNLRQGAVISGTINYATGIIALNLPNPTAIGAVTITFTYAKCLPVMGLPNRELAALNAEELLAFDEDDAYLWNTATTTFNLITPAIGWTGNNANFFWGWNYWTNAAGDNLLWVTNNVPADRIRYYIGGGAGGWTTLTPQLNNAGVPARSLYTCLLIVSYRNRLVCLNTQEDIGGVLTNYKNRARWSRNGNPNIPASAPTIATNWEDDVVGLGGYVDAPTTERIVTAKFVKDTLVVGFERSTWNLKYTGNELLPFIWERVHEEQGCESTFSSVVFDTHMLQVGYRGINAANSNSVERIDMKDPYLVQEIENGHEGQIRVHGIKDYNLQMVYWTYSTASYDTNAYPKIFPDSIIAYNYYEQAFSTYDASFTCFGNYQPFNDLTWAGMATIRWADANFAWNSGQGQSGYPYVVAGNQVGFVHLLRESLGNSSSVYISGATLAIPCVITAPNHNFQDGQCIYIDNVIGTTQLNGNVYFTNQCAPNTFQLQKLDTNPASPTYGQRIDEDSTLFTAYSGYGLITPIDNFSIFTKQYNPYQEEDVKARIGILELFMTTTIGGEITLDVYVDQNESSPIAYFIVDTAADPSPDISAKKYWQKVFVNTVANYIQFDLNFNDFQMNDISQNLANVELHAINIQSTPSGQRSSFS